MAQEHGEQPFFLKATNPVNFPEHPALHYNAEDFDAYLKKNVKPLHAITTSEKPVSDGSSTDVQSTQGVLGQDKGESLTLRSKSEEGVTIPPKSDQPFMHALQSADDGPDRDMSNMMVTENNDLAHASTKSPLVDLFFELEEVLQGSRLTDLLAASWETDPVATLKIIFNARSIHLGKSSRVSFYRCLGWLARFHPVTLLVNLQWLTRPVIEKKMSVDKGEKDDMVMVEMEKAEDDPTRHDQKNGVAHGYWKDLLNILVLAAEGELNETSNPKDVLNSQKPANKARTWDHDEAKNKRETLKKSRHDNAVHMFNEQSFYAALHMLTARLFADRLRADLSLLKSGDKKAASKISLCGKWAPSSTLFHDKHTCIVSTIAELLHPKSEFPSVTDRETYLRYAREAYRKDISSLRKALEVVERDLAASTLENINYERVPSQAMSQYAGIFVDKDGKRFEEYIEKVAAGEQKISGATLLPSTLVSKVTGSHVTVARTKTLKTAVSQARQRMEAKVIDGQWNSLVQRIKDSGTLENSMAVCDVSGSMGYPSFEDGTCPMDSAVGLSLLLSEVTKAPFGGTFITFSEHPQVVQVQGTTLHEKVKSMKRADWGMTTDFVAVFEQLILPLAVKHKVKQEDMVKKLFVFSDMQFNQANVAGNKWTTSFERIKAEYAAAGYEMPQLVFWNLAGGRAGMMGHGDPVAPKPVEADEQGTALVSGYSQGMLKVFLDNGAFEDPEAEEEIVEEEVTVGEDDEEDDGEVIVQVQKKQKMDPLSTVRKAISHKGYSMLAVVD